MNRESARGISKSLRRLLPVIVLAFDLTAADLEKTQKKALEGQVKTMTADAAKLEKAGQLAEARIKYAQSQALIEVKNVTDAIKHLDEEIHKRAKEALAGSRKLYEARKFQEAADVLDKAAKLQAFGSVLAYDLALCYYQLGDRNKALEYLQRAKPGMTEPKQKEKLSQLVTFVTTGEAGVANDNEKEHIGRINRLSDSVGLEAFLLETAVEDNGGAAESKTHSNSGHRTNLCNAIGELKGPVASRPSAMYNLANCAETNGRTEEAVRLLERYLEAAPNALDADDTRVRIADLKSLLTVKGQNGVEVRRLFASANNALAERQYEVALSMFDKAVALAPQFALTRWKLALLHEAMRNVDRARENFLSYQQLTPDKSAKEEAERHLSTLEARSAKYDEEVDATGDIIADLFNRAMNLTYNGSEKRSALRAKRAQVKNKNEKAQAKNRVGGFAIPFAYAQQQLGLASEHLETALALFPLGAEANELMGLVALQANDGRLAIKSFDVVASHGLPISFYAEMRGRKQDRAVKCELTHDRIRMIYLSSYDKKGNPTAPAKRAGDDGLGDMVIEPDVPRQPQFDSLDVTLNEIKKIETDKGLLSLKLAQQQIWLSPIYLPTFTPIEGPQARRFANNYTRLFVRYPGLENSKLGAEGMTGGEKFKMGYNLANAGFDMAMSGFNPIGIASSVQDAISITRTIRAAMVSLKVSYAAWEKNVGEQQQLLAGMAFKTIPSQTVNLEFMHEVK